METLERYLNDCETKRRRMRDRPSDAVVTELRWLLDRARGADERRSESGGEASDSGIGPEDLPRA